MGPVADPRTYISDYLAFIQHASDLWLAEPGNDPATVTAMSSSTSFQQTAITYSHTVNTPAGSSTVTQVRNVGAVSIEPVSAAAIAAGATGTVTATVHPSDSTVTAVSDQIWLTVSVAGNVVTWTAAPNTGSQRFATVQISTAGGGLMQPFTVNQDAGV